MKYNSITMQSIVDINLNYDMMITNLLQLNNDIQNFYQKIKLSYYNIYDIIDDLISSIRIYNNKNKI